MDETKDSKPKKVSDLRAEAAAVPAESGQKLFDDGFGKLDRIGSSLKSDGTNNTELASFGINMEGQASGNTNAFRHLSPGQDATLSTDTEYRPGRTQPNIVDAKSSIKEEINSRQIVKDAFMNSPMVVNSPSLMQEKMERITARAVEQKFQERSGYGSYDTKQTEAAKIDPSPASSRPSWDNGGTVFDQLKAGNIKGVGACGPEDSRSNTVNKVEARPADSYERAQILPDNPFKQETGKIFGEAGSGKFAEKTPEPGPRYVEPTSSKEGFSRGLPDLRITGEAGRPAAEAIPQASLREAAIRDPKESSRINPDGHESARIAEQRDVFRAPEASRIPDLRENQRTTSEFSKTLSQHYQAEQIQERLRTNAAPEPLQAQSLPSNSERGQHTPVSRVADPEKAEREGKLKIANDQPNYIYAAPTAQERPVVQTQVRPPEFPFSSLARSANAMDSEQIAKAASLSVSAGERSPVALRSETAASLGLSPERLNGNSAGNQIDRLNLLPASNERTLNAGMLNMPQDRLPGLTGSVSELGSKQIARLDDGINAITGRRETTALPGLQEATRMSFEGTQAIKTGIILDANGQRIGAEAHSGRQAELILTGRVIGTEAASTVGINGKVVTLAGEVPGTGMQTAEVAGIRQATLAGLDGGADSDDAAIEFVKTGKLISSEKRYLTGVEVTMAAILALSGAARLRNEKVSEDNESGSENESLIDAKHDTANQKNLHRRTHLVSTGESLQSIAEDFYQNVDIAWLIADLNANNIKEEWIEGKRVIEIKSRQLIELPDHEEVKTFLDGLKKDFDIDKLVTVVSESTIDLELLNNFLGTVSGGVEEVQPAPVELATIASKAPANPLPELTIDMGYPENLLPVAAGITNMVKDISHRVGRLVKRQERKLGTA